MNTDLLRQWLGLQETAWPPEPAKLLGIPAVSCDPSKCDLAQLEQIVHDRIASLRCYQISHPEEATEGMNRLAQAYLQIMEVPPASPPVPIISEPTRPTTIENPVPALDWQKAPPPVRGMVDSSASVAVIEAPPTQEQELVTFTLVPPPPPKDPGEITEEEIRRWAVESLEARAGLATMSALVDRVYQTRALLHAWQMLGKYLRKTSKEKSKLASPADFAKRVGSVVSTAADFPTFFGQPGKPGYRVVALARLSLTPEMFETMDRTQRKLLSKDWANGEKVLLVHRRFLFAKFRQLRRKSSAYLGLRAVWNILRDSPALVTLLVMFAIVSVAISFYLSR